LLVERLLSFVTSAVITVSDYDRELALRNRLFRPEEITTVHNGMPDNGLRAELGSTPEVRLVMVARFQPQKDHATLFAALEKLADLPWRLDLVGDGPGLAAWSEWVKLHGWSNRVTFHGLIFDVSTVLASSQIFVLASRWEGFPNSILEAMRTGLPVVATDVGGVAEAVKDGITGLLVPVGDASSLAHALTKLIGDSEERRTFGTAGRARFENDFTFEVMLSRTVTVWSRIAKCTSPPSS
jgi:glycosyltransferase involved in cell wall biosynthesis